MKVGLTFGNNRLNYIYTKGKGCMCIHFSFFYVFRSFDSGHNGAPTFSSAHQPQKVFFVIPGFILTDSYA